MGSPDSKWGIGQMESREDETVALSPEKAPTLVGASVTWRAMTHKGLERVQNEDAHWVSNYVGTETGGKSDLRYLFAIADGLGGHQGGAMASRIAMKSVQEDFNNWRGGAADSLVDRAMRHANDEVFGVAHSDPGLFADMQTTLTLVALEGGSLTVGHVGDCRLYRARGGCIDVLTRDHTYANDLLQMHLISVEQAANHPGRHRLTRSVGSELFLHTDIVREQIQPDDTYLLCSDGLWGELSNGEIREAMQEENIDTAGERLVRLALKAGAQDNITAIVFRVVIVGKQSAPLLSWQTLRQKLHV